MPVDRTAPSSRGLTRTIAIPPSWRATASDDIDSTPRYPQPPDEHVRAAERCIPQLLANVEPTPRGEVTLVASYLAERIRNENHTLAAAHWAIHWSIRAGRLRTGRIVNEQPSYQPRGGSHWSGGHRYTVEVRAAESARKNSSPPDAGRADDRERRPAGPGVRAVDPVYGLQNRRLADATGGFRRRRRWRRDDNPNTGTAERHREFSRSIRASGGSPVSAPAWGETTAETRVTQTLAEIGVK
jgi:hypothetical protein